MSSLIFYFLKIYQMFQMFLSFSFFLPCCIVCGILVPQPGLVPHQLTLVKVLVAMLREPLLLLWVPVTGTPSFLRALLSGLWPVGMRWIRRTWKCLSSKPHHL